MTDGLYIPPTREALASEGFLTAPVPEVHLERREGETVEQQCSRLYEEISTVLEYAKAHAARGNARASEMVLKCANTALKALELRAKLEGKLQVATVNVMLAEIGLPGGLEEAKRLAAEMRATGSPSLEEQLDAGIQLMQAVLVSRPDWAARVKEALFHEREVSEIEEATGLRDADGRERQGSDPDHE